MSTQVHFTHTVPSFCPEIRWSLTSIVYWYWACANYMKWHSKWLNWPITFNDQLYNIIDWQILFTWLWRWLPLRLSKRQSPKTVLFRTNLNRTITKYELHEVSRDSWCWPKGARPLGTRMLFTPERKFGSYSLWGEHENIHINLCCLLQGKGCTS